MEVYARAWLLVCILFIAAYSNLVRGAVLADEDLAIELCSHVENAICPTGADRVENDVRFKSFVKLRDQVQSNALLKAAELKSAGGCAESTTDGPKSKSPAAIQSWILDEDHVDTNERRIRRGVCYSQILEAEVFSKLTKTFSKTDLDKTFETVRSAMIDVVTEQVIGNSKLNSANPEMISELKKVQLITSKRYDEWGKLGVGPKDAVMIGHGYNYLSNPDGGICGRDLMRVNVMASSTGYNNVFTGMLAVVVCPMAILWTAQNESSDVASSWYHLLGHEIGHHIHAIRNRAALNHVDVNGNALTTNFAPAYFDFIQCMHTHYDTEMYPDQEPGLLAHQNLEKILGYTGVHGLDFQLAEISADFLGNQVLSKIISQQTMNPAKAARTVYESLKRFCIDQSGKKSLEVRSASHPTLGSRMRFALDYPSIRLALSCKDLKTSRGACGFLGEIH